MTEFNQEREREREFSFHVFYTKSYVLHDKMFFYFEILFYASNISLNFDVLLYFTYFQKEISRWPNLSNSYLFN